MVAGNQYIFQKESQLALRPVGVRVFYDVVRQGRQTGETQLKNTSKILDLASQGKKHALTLNYQEIVIAVGPDVRLDLRRRVS